jgi:Etoposide-induced protein 2.4 (EI24)
LSFESSGLMPPASAQFKWMADAWWRSAIQCFHPRVILLSILPFVLCSLLAGTLAYLFWNESLLWMDEQLRQSVWLEPIWRWLEGVGLAQVKSTLVPLMLVMLSMPILLLLSVLTVSVMVGGHLSQWVAKRRFPDLVPKGTGAWWKSLAWTLTSCLSALLLWLISLPLWLVPPLAVVVTPLIWAWLTYRVMAFDALVPYADSAERRHMFHHNRWAWWAMGLLCSLATSLPALLLAFLPPLASVFFVFLAPLMIWCYMLVLMFGVLWFSHHALAALHQFRQNSAPNLPTNGA